VRIFLLVSRGWGWRFEASGAVRSLVFVITPEGFSVNAFLCVESPKYKCGCRSGKSCFLTYDQAQAEIKRFRARRSSFVSLQRAGSSLGFSGQACLPKVHHFSAVKPGKGTVTPAPA
jgi:hypothetical protein